MPTATWGASCPRYRSVSVARKVLFRELRREHDGIERLQVRRCNLTSLACRFGFASVHHEQDASVGSDRRRPAKPHRDWPIGGGIEEKEAALRYVSDFRGRAHLSGVGSEDITAGENTTDNCDHRIAKAHEAPRVEDRPQPAGILSLQGRLVSCHHRLQPRRWARRDNLIHRQGGSTETSAAVCTQIPTQILAGFLLRWDLRRLTTAISAAVAVGHLMKLAQGLARFRNATRSDCGAALASTRMTPANSSVSAK
jgi:hypothetical protein